MKVKKYLHIAMIASAVALQGCKKDFLVRAPQGSLSGEEMATKKGVNVLLIGAYAALSAQDYIADNIVSLGNGNAWGVSASNWLLGSAAGGEAHKGSDGTDQPSFIPIFNFSITPS